MSDKHTGPGSGPADEPGNQADQKARDFAHELRELAQQLEDLIRSNMTPERARAMQGEILGGMREIGVQFQEALKAVQSDTRMNNLSERGQQTVEEAQRRVHEAQSKVNQHFGLHDNPVAPVVEEFQKTVAGGLKFMSKQLAEFAERLDHDKPTSSPDTPPPATPPITPPPPAGTPPITPPPPAGNTGPTVRLDPDKQD